VVICPPEVTSPTSRAYWRVKIGEFCPLTVAGKGDPVDEAPPAKPLFASSIR
jgi:hypothetical protein